MNFLTLLLLVKLTDLSAAQRSNESGLYGSGDMGVSFALMGKCWETNGDTVLWVCERSCPCSCSNIHCFQPLSQGIRMRSWLTTEIIKEHTEHKQTLHSTLLQQHSGFGDLATSSVYSLILN